MTAARSPDHRGYAADVRSSRIVRLAAAVTGRDENDLRGALDSSHTVVSFEPSLAGSLETAHLLVSSLARVPGAVTLVVAAHHDDQLQSWAPGLSAVFEALRPNSLLPVTARVADAVSPTSVHLHIGLEECRDARCKATSRACVRVIPDGYGACLVRWGQISQARRPYATGHMLAAAFAAGEAFRFAAGLDTDPERSRTTSFCPVTLADDLTAAPDLPASTVIDAALLGLGAVGTAAAAILSAMDMTGSITLADNQIFATENIGTYTLGTQADADHAIHKVDLAAHILAPRYQVYEHKGDIEALPARIDGGELPWPAIVLSAVDTIASRHAVQRIWADQHIDVGTGSTVLGLHHARAAGPCLRCFFPQPTTGPTAEQRLAAKLGIDAGLLGRDEPWTDAEIAALPPTADPRIATLSGKPKCATANLLGLTAHQGAEEYMPSVPFVSQQAACLLAGRLIAEVLGLDADTNFFQNDALIGPSLHNGEVRDVTATCYCQQRGDLITKVRAARRAA